MIGELRDWISKSEMQLFYIMNEEEKTNFGVHALRIKSKNM
jgi:hypothetical protein